MGEALYELRTVWVWEVGVCYLSSNKYSSSTELMHCLRVKCFWHEEIEDRLSTPDASLTDGERSLFYQSGIWWYETGVVVKTKSGGEEVLGREKKYLFVCTTKPRQILNGKSIPQKVSWICVYKSLPDCSHQSTLHLKTATAVPSHQSTNSSFKTSLHTMPQVTEDSESKIYELQDNFSTLHRLEFQKVDNSSSSYHTIKSILTIFRLGSSGRMTTTPMMLWPSI